MKVSGTNGQDIQDKMLTVTGKMPCKSTVRCHPTPAGRQDCEKEKVSVYNKAEEELSPPTAVAGM